MLHRRCTCTTSWVRLMCGCWRKTLGGGVEQVFAFALLNADYQMAELGYVDLSELLLLGFELDFHFSPKPLAEVRESVRKRLGLF